MNIYQTSNCKFCNKKLYGKRLTIHENVCLSNPNRIIIKHTEETKKLLSDKRKQYLKDNPDKHPWKNKNKFLSKPCNKVKEYLIKNNIKFIEELNPLEDRAFSIDIAFPDQMIGIEVNGNQHYNRDGTLKPYYQERHDIITQAGWKLIELPYIAAYNEEILNKAIVLGIQPDYTQYFEEKERKRLSKEKEKALPLGVKNRIRYDNNALPKIKLVKEANIDFNKFGWLSLVGKIISKRHAGTKRFMQRYFPDIYKTAYKRDGSISLAKRNKPVYDTKSIGNKKWEFMVSFIKQSDYDFSKPEWKKYIRELLSEHIVRVRPKEWMKRYMSDFYQLYCYKD